MNRLNEYICKTRICIVESFERRHHNNTSLSVKSSRLNESELTTSQTAHSVPLPHISLSSLPIDDTTSWTIG